MNTPCYVYWYHLSSHSNVFCEGYIGVTVNLETRDRNHRIHELKYDSVLRKAIKKYGSENIIRTILCITTIEAAYILEEKLRPTKSIGWNIVKGGGLPPDCTGRKHTEEAKQKISKSNIATKSTRVYVSKFKGTTGRWTDEQKKKIGKRPFIRKLPDNFKEIMQEKNSGSKNHASCNVSLYNIHNIYAVFTFDTITEAAKTLSITLGSMKSMSKRYRSVGISPPNKQGWVIKFNRGVE